MWTIYDIHSDRYWNEQHRCWCALEEATQYTTQERDRRALDAVVLQWKFVATWFQRKSATGAAFMHL